MNLRRYVALSYRIERFALRPEGRREACRATHDELTAMWGDLTDSEQEEFCRFDRWLTAEIEADEASALAVFNDWAPLRAAANAAVMGEP